LDARATIWYENRRRSWDSRREIGKSERDLEVQVLLRHSAVLIVLDRKRNCELMVNFEKWFTSARSKSNKVIPRKSSIGIETCRSIIVERKGNVDCVPRRNFFVPVILEDIVVFIQLKSTAFGARKKGE